MKGNLRKTVFTILAISAITAGLFSCEKPLQGNSVNADFRKYFDYQPGSYWIFYDSLNHYTDSVSVTNYNDVKVNGITDESITIGMHEFYIDSAANDTEWVLSLDAPYGAGFDFYIGLTDNRYDFLDKMPFQTGTIYSKTTIFSSWTTTLLPSYTQEGVVYKNVYKITYAYVDNSADTICINADNGFIAVLLHNQNFRKRLFLKRNLLIN